jgi:DNA-binding CsgD family transcriptional regulator
MTDPLAALSDRERQVAIMLAIGARNAAIAIALDINIKTVDTHRSRVLKKLGAKNNVALARMAIRDGWASMHDGEAL